MDLRTQQFTLFDSYARNDKRTILGKAEVARLQEYLVHLAVREHDKPIEWQEPLFPQAGEKSPQQYALHDKSKKLSGIDCGLFCLFYAVALSYGRGDLHSARRTCRCSDSVQFSWLSARPRSLI